MKTNKYKERLFKEWLQHGKIIIAVDFDSTISPYHTIDNIEDIEKVIETIKNAKYTGAYITIFTACNPDRFDDIEKYCKEKGIELDSINQNPIDLPYGNHSKIYANVFLDDRAGLNEALETLNDAMYMYRGYVQSKKMTENSPE